MTTLFFKRRLTVAASAVALMALGGCMHTQSRAIDMAYPTDYRQRHPIMVSPSRASVPHQCGQWPGDLGVSDAVMSAHNKPYWNHGCATQQNLAAMVANPNDLLYPAQETAPDTVSRLSRYEKFRKGTDPSTQYNGQQTQKLVGGQ